MSALHDKIQSYSPEVNIEFDTAYSTNPTNTGSVTLSAWALTGGSITRVTGDSPVGGAGSCWTTATGSTSRFRNLTSAFQTTLVDRDFFNGIWIKFSALPTGNSSSTFSLISISPHSSTWAYNISLSGTGFSSGPSKLFMQGPTTTYLDIGGPTIQANRWYYLGVRRTPGNISVFLDGSLIYSLNNSNTTGTSPSFTLGMLSGDTTGTFRFSNLHSGTSANFTPTAISEIWTAGSSTGAVDVNNIETPATASAQSVFPTISRDTNNLEAPATASALMTQVTTTTTQQGEHVEITTSILVSAEFPPASVSTQRFINLTVGPATVYSEMGQENQAVSSNFVSFPAVVATASAVIVKPFLSESPMTASAQMGNHVIFVTPNYFNAVKQLNPYLYINNGGSSIVNHGYQSGTFSRGSDLLTLQDGGAPLNLVREGDSWKGDASSNSQSWIEFTTDTAEQGSQQLIASGTFAFEFWAKPLSLPSQSSAVSSLQTNKSFLETSALCLRLSPADASGDTRSLELEIRNSSSTIRQVLRTGLTNSGISLNNWNHIVVNVYQSGINANQRLVQVWVNGSVRINQNISFTPWTSETAGSRIIGSNASGLNLVADSFFDEIAWYSDSLTNSEIINHYQLISNLSPNFQESAEEFTASAESGVHQFTVTSNAIPEIKEATASALLIAPTIIAGRSFTHNAAAVTASATSIIPVISYGITYLATPSTAFAEFANAYHLNSIYYDYVQANIMPYRYVTFDAANVYADYGTDSDYTTQPVVVGGTIVNPDEGISGKSAKTAGTSYVTDGVILKESEYADDWGTLGNRYHSAFWIQKAEEDNSTGLRVIWNLNSHYDNQHIILYQYQGKLTLSFSDGSNTYINQTTTSNINLFDGQRHFVVVYTDHQGTNDSTYLYVDSVLVMTVALGSYRIETINGTSLVGPNDETNNHPRLSVGSLITPLAATALPVVPTNTRLIIDEVYWAKTAINQSMVTALYNIMPDKNNSDSMADPMLASGLMVSPAISTQSINLVNAATASALITPVTIRADRNIVRSVAAATAGSTMPGGLRINNIIIASDVMVATAIFNSAGVRITIPGGPMLATMSLIDRPGRTDPIPGQTGDDYWGGIVVRTNVTGRNISSWYVLSPWAAWLRATDVKSIIPMSEVN